MRRRDKCSAAFCTRARSGLAMRSRPSVRRRLRSAQIVPPPEPARPAGGSENTRKSISLGYRPRCTRRSRSVRNTEAWRSSDAVMMHVSRIGTLSLLVVSSHPVRVCARADVIDPLHVLKVPGDRAVEPFLEAHGGPPAQLTLDLRAIDRITPVVARPVFHKGDKLLIVGGTFSGSARNRRAQGSHEPD